MKLVLLAVAVCTCVASFQTPPQGGAAAARVVLNRGPSRGLEDKPRTTHRLRSAVRAVSSGGQSLATGKTNFGSETSGLFGNFRVPAALFAGAAAGAAFALPILPTDDLRLGIIKRLYALLMIGALSTQLLTVMVATLVVGSISSRSHADAPTLLEWIDTNYGLEFAASRFAFLTGLLSFVLAVGLRAFITIGCPVIARSALGVVASGALLCLAFIQEHLESREVSLRAVGSLFASKLMKKSQSSPLFFISSIVILVTSGYLAMSMPGIVMFLMSKK